MSIQDPSKPVLHKTTHQGTGADKLTGFLVFLIRDDTPGAPVANLTTLQTLKTIAIPANSYANILVEAIAQFNMNRSAAAKNVAYWYIKENGTTRKGFVERFVNTASPATITGPTRPTKIDAVIAGGQAGGTNIVIMGAMMVANAGDSIKCECVRLWGII